MRIQVLYFEGCPNCKPAIDLVRSIAPNATIEEVEIKTQQEAEQMRFLGSPTVLVDGVDVEPSARTRTDFGLICRTYSGKGLPSRELIASAIAVDCCSLRSIERSPSRWLAASSVIVAALASACCWLPLVLLAFGWSAAGSLATLEPLRPWLLAGTALLLAAGLYSAYRNGPCCTPKSGRFSRALVWMSTAAALAFALFSLYAGVLADAVKGPACCMPSESPSETSLSSAWSFPLAERVSFYAVPLRCHAAPEIGCGSRAKPVLRELERVSGINEAWLNRAGTQIAVVWAEGGASKTRMNDFEAVLKKRKLSATELADTARVEALKEFQSGAGWHRSADVDQLSEEEAGIIAARITRRLQAKASLSEAKAETLQGAMAETLKTRFLGSPDEPSRTPDQEREVFLKAAASYLNEMELTALREAMASGLGPLPGEQ